MNLKKYIKKQLHEAFENQEALDKLLDKINKVGYDGLDGTEKSILNSISKSDKSIGFPEWLESYAGGHINEEMIEGEVTNTVRYNYYTHGNERIMKYWDFNNNKANTLIVLDDLYAKALRELDLSEDELNAELIDWAQNDTHNLAPIRVVVKPHVTY